MAVPADGLTADRFVLRPVAADDRPVCASIAAVTYGGRDYLMTALERWLGDPAKFTAMCLAHPETNQLAAVETLARIDGGETGWLEGLRTHPDWRGRGLARRLQTELAAIAAAEAGKPGARLRRLRYTTSSGNAASLKLAEHVGLERVASWGWTFANVGDGRAAERVEAAAGTHAAAALAEMGPEDMASACEGPGAAALGISDVVLADWKAYQVRGRARAAIGELVAASGTIFVQGEGGVSLGQRREDVSSASWYATLYSGGDESAAVAHLAWHIAAARSRGLDDLMIMFPEAHGPRMRELLGAPLVEAGDRCVMVERELKAEG